jgi:hypothetical protein
MPVVIKPNLFSLAVLRLRAAYRLRAPPEPLAIGDLQVKSPLFDQEEIMTTT